MIVAIATNNIAVTSKRLSDAMKFKSELRKHFTINDRGELQWFLGLEM